MFMHFFQQALDNPLTISIITISIITLSQFGQMFTLKNAYSIAHILPDMNRFSRVIKPDATIIIIKCYRYHYEILPLSLSSATIIIRPASDATIVIIRRYHYHYQTLPLSADQYQMLPLFIFRRYHYHYQTLPLS